MNKYSDNTMSNSKSPNTGDFEEEVKSGHRAVRTGITTGCRELQTDGKFRFK